MKKFHGMNVVKETKLAKWCEKDGSHTILVPANGGNSIGWMENLSTCNINSASNRYDELNKGGGK